jgi:hypothetical protein
MNEALAYAAGLIAVGWGIAHLMPTGKVVAGYEPLSRDNRLVLTMEWAAEGVTLIFLGLLAVLVTARGGAANDVTISVYAAVAAMLVTMALLTALTGARTSVIFFRICPLVKTTAAILLVAAILV